MRKRRRRCWLAINMSKHKMTPARGTPEEIEPGSSHYYVSTSQTLIYERQLSQVFLEKIKLLSNRKCRHHITSYNI